ncbi:hypothetical protein BDB00DRAFT_929899 [Zychaea mexicana]|uniref:uncharacterized protein n=1 Tax=Zychaea mexicana TaxID=64656 RepID=UPI0022FE1A54|nr:uncharacterized protein BDB00DRAFT_929899 [Zychaea mexicana]KAI9492185.1 hypothetical protein BDB00DRAFT_929899 [Zychaea mexicana]
MSMNATPNDVRVFKTPVRRLNRHRQQALAIPLPQPPPPPPMAPALMPATSSAAPTFTSPITRMQQQLQQLKNKGKETNKGLQQLNVKKEVKKAPEQPKKEQQQQQHSPPPPTATTTTSPPPPTAAAATAITSPRLPPPPPPFLRQQQQQLLSPPYIPAFLQDLEDVEMDVVEEAVDMEWETGDERDMLWDPTPHLVPVYWPYYGP